VSTIPGFSMNRYGVYGEETIIPAAMTVTHPNSLRWEHAAAIWMPYMTAYGALVDTALLTPGDAVIITAASSSVGLAAIRSQMPQAQFRSLRRARVPNAVHCSAMAHTT
jgi:NADPH2:quinone reductase